MMNDSKPILAGKAFSKLIQDDPEAASGLREAQRKLKMFAELIEPYRSDISESVVLASGEIEKFHQEWKSKYGVEYPTDDYDLIELVVACGIELSPREFTDGSWEPDALLAMVQGKLRPLVTATGGGVEENEKTEIKWPGKLDSNFLRWLAREYPKLGKLKPLCTEYAGKDPHCKDIDKEADRLRTCARKYEIHWKPSGGNSSTGGST